MDSKFILHHRRIKNCQIEIEYIKQEKRLVLISEREFNILIRNLIALYIPPKERKLINKTKGFYVDQKRIYLQYDQIEEDSFFDMVQCVETIYEVEKLC